ncbi:methylated-DNA--[protein]-cysteine S-methyltransferase [Haliovirga abyssi]|uniref:Methylated-DNA--protein-cysteine methyltransferase n=1 Tax=Haliovirga abyssi TaxID=2996794 RepID=A0AAU9DGG0_9FUSO|nr:methylated-DNA--[protein]-cysteine S-methyltransferase [Haliovirga abyssi]BDU50527.1 hypothetical protein HLVA_10960 [Haliovirga abyssi]
MEYKEFYFEIDDIKFYANYFSDKLINLNIIENIPQNIKESNPPLKLYDYLVGYLSGCEIEYSGEYQLNLTEKEKIVLENCRKISYGKILSYKELAEKAGFKNGSRFVGNVMAKNPIILIFPCHRVIKSNGEYGNYGPGVNYKIKFLNIERRDKND